MKIAVFESEGRVTPQCGEISQVVVVDVDPVSRNVRQTALLTPPPAAIKPLEDWLRSQEVEVLLTNGIGRHTLKQLEQQGIRVIVGVPPFRVEPVIANFLSGTLETGGNPCEQPTGGRE